MRGPRPAPCIFPEYFLQEARVTVRRRSAPLRDLQRSRLILFWHEHPERSAEEAARCVGLSMRQAQRWRQRWVTEEFSIDDKKGRGPKPTFSPMGSSLRDGDGM